MNKKVATNFLGFAWVRTLPPKGYNIMQRVNKTGGKL